MTTNEISQDNWQEYLVEWSTWLDAPSPAAAAEIARDLITNGPQTIFVVRDGETTTVIDAEDGSIVRQGKDNG
jgi:basic membrane lipoprotein Med (substrate-binding protein (PBP1-ABC) superfamily)